MKSNAIHEESTLSWSEFLREIHLPSLALVSLAVWLHAADTLVVATMLPSIVADIGGQSLVGWSVALYEIGSIMSGAASALLVLRYGLRLPMSIAAVIFGIGCFVSAIGNTMPIVLAGRLLQGSGGGGLVAMGFVIVSVVFERRYIARALAIVSAFWGMSAFLGPLIGGIFVEFATWRLGFAFFGLQALGLAIWIAWQSPKQHLEVEHHKTHFPTARLGLLCASVILVAVAGIDINPIKTTVLVFFGLIAFILFIFRDANAKTNSRLLPPSPLDPRTPAGATLSMILALAIATIPITAFGPLLITAIYGVSALTVGFIVASSSIGWTATAIAVSSAPERLDGLFILVGISLVIFSIPCFIFSVTHGSLWLIALSAAIEGGGFGIAWTFILRRTTSLSPPEESQRIAGALPTIQRFGYAIGATYIGLIANAAGFLDMTTPAEAKIVAQIIFVSCVPPGLLALPGLWGIVRPQRGFSLLQ
ncbi:MAG: MFS transporter [Aestuariivita sp.]|nr:MFS transporter [Aestuariivita sp.]